ncbi:uncharacterized protein Z518_04203 [Rhinocladiella mackenziei CBS 650.93]|uniref:Rhinocladiella mackenziei CBS 650.93 unplaced genomic scaffold supercont1.3, whole genome shotgun sequence n=1 Tax=Rhinocladiella mackenziei CBS 650.93 TaxID=1442369 RepID=A0A0D2H744_9EURO|nr:uncharacterized protein Z518_04203 [Rhinocladiella mackenziei CBS 650.93]KIX06228.1 hypothetical protein Z518_04203 [Rhinocladiella mackenziei CBS 650.93]
MEKTDLDKAIELLQEALQQTPLDHPNRPSRLEDLGNGYGCRYHLNRDPVDLDLSIRASRLHALRTSYQYRSTQKGSLEGLSEAIRLYYASLNMASSGDPQRVPQLACLGAAYDTRFRAIGTIADVDAVVYLFKESADKTPPNHPELASRLQSLGKAYEGRYHSKGEDEDFKLAVQSQQRSLGNTAPPDHRGDLDFWNLLLCTETVLVGQRIGSIWKARPLRLCILGTKYASRYDVQTALRVLQDAISITKPDDPQSAFRLDLLGVTYKNRYRHTGSKEDLDMAIQRLQNSFDHTQSGA